MKPKASFFGTMLLASLVFGAPLPASAATSPNVLLSEVNWAGSALSTADEWLELANLGATPADISDWSLAGAAGSSGDNIVFPKETVLAGYGSYLLSNYDLASGKTTLTATPNLVTTAVSLANSKLNVALIDATGNVVDTATTDSVPKTGSTLPFASMERDFATGSWITAASSTNLTDATQLGTPGWANVPTAAITEPVPSAPVSPIDESTEAPLVPASGEASDPDTNDEAALATETSVATEPVEMPSEIPTVSETLPEETIDASGASAKSVVIVEFMSAPSNGAAEWITFYNTTMNAIDLTGWTVADATGKTTELFGILEPSTSTTVENPKGKLNNDGDTILLVDASGVIVDQITYGSDDVPKPGSDETLVLVGGAWVVRGAVVEEVAVPEEEPALATTEEVTPVIETVVTEPVMEAPPVSEPSPVVDAIEAEPAPTESKAIQDETGATDQTTEEIVITESAESSATLETLATPVAPETSRSYASGDVLITEFVSDPADGTEWIEIYNATTEAIDLTGWTVADGTGKTTELSGSLAPSMYGTVESPKGKLNNDGDEIIVADPSGNVIDQLTYGTDEIPKPKKGTSVALAEDLWIVTAEPTPGNTNFIPEETTYDESSSVAVADDAATSTSVSEANAVGATTDSTESQTVSNAHQVHGGSVARLSTASDVSAATSSSGSLKIAPVSSPNKITKAKTVASTTKKSSSSSAASATVTYTGTVTALPGTFGSQIAFIDGIEVYFNAADWPVLQLGDVIQVRGIPSTAQGESRVKISTASALTVLRHEEESAQSIAISAVSTAKEGSLVRIEGTIATRNGKTLTLEDDSGQIDVVAYEKTGLSWSGYTGGTLQIVGVVRYINGKTFVYPRSLNDITVVKDALSEASIASTTTLAEGTDSASGTSGTMLPMLGAILAAAGVSTGVLWLLKRRQIASALFPLAENPS